MDLKTAKYDTELNLFGYQAFVNCQMTFGQALKAVFGVNVVGNNFSNNMLNPLNQFSPRLSTSYEISDKWDISKYRTLHLSPPILQWVSRKW